MDKVVDVGFLFGYTNIFECSIKTVEVKFVKLLQSTLESLGFVVFSCVLTGF